MLGCRAYKAADTTETTLLALAAQRTVQRPASPGSLLEMQHHRSLPGPPFPPLHFDELSR